VRRRDREKSAEWALELLKTCEYATVATLNADGSPYCATVSPVLHGGALYFHGAIEGQKLDNIRRDGRVSVSAVGRTRVEPDRFRTDYESAVISGTCSVVDEREEKIAALRALCVKYSPGFAIEADAKIDRQLDVTCVCKITISQITGKESKR
jgi:nitroimidazol reductase NimA-like FMN-containing flavoprotein (pyridoxamine 5'-phosphate oxidase superfamily)